MRHKNIALAIVTAIAAIGAGWGIRAVAEEVIADRSGTLGQSVCQSLREGFNDYPLLFVGDEIDGQELQTCQHRASAGEDSGRQASNSFFFVYGKCTPDGGDEPSCAVPLQLSFDWSCGPTPVWVGSVPTVRDRGLTLHVGGDGHV